MGMPGSAISDHEHVAFLLYWLNSIIFCSKRVKAQTTLLPLAALLHEGRKLCLSKLLLARLYEEISHVVRLIKGGKNFNPGGPFWLLQIWLNAIFEPLLRYSPPAILYRDIKGRDCVISTMKNPKI